MAAWLCMAGCKLLRRDAERWRLRRLQCMLKVCSQLTGLLTLSDLSTSREGLEVQHNAVC